MFRELVRKNKQLSIAAIPRRTFSSRERKPSVSNRRSLIASFENMGIPSSRERHWAIVLLPEAGMPETRMQIGFMDFPFFPRCTFSSQSRGTSSVCLRQPPSPKGKVYFVYSAIFLLISRHTASKSSSISRFAKRITCNPRLSR